MGYQNSETPEPINVKFGEDDYVGDITLHAKIQGNRPQWQRASKLRPYFTHYFTH